MFTFVQNLLERIYDAYAVRQLNSFFCWVRAHSITPDEVAHLHFPTFSYAQTVERKKAIFSTDPAYIVCSPDERKNAFSHLVDTVCGRFVLIFNSPCIEVWENTSRYKNDLPIRFGLTEAEKKELLKIAKRTLYNFFHEKEPEISLTNSSPRMNELADLDVVLWVNGSVRGSQMVFNIPLAQAVRDATIRSLNDTRFKSIEVIEYDSIIVEIVLMNDLRIPLFKNDLEKNEIYAEKGYLYESSGVRGWYIPPVFNCTLFSNLDHFIKKLGIEKAGVRPSLRMGSVLIFEVQDFIETDNVSPLTLHNSTPVKTTDGDLDKTILNSRLVEMSISFLEKSQDYHGNIIPIIDPFGRSFPEIDWTRVSFTTHALTQYGLKTENTKCLDIASRSYDFLKKNLLSSKVSLYELCISSIYTAKIARALKDDVYFEKHIGVINDLIQTLKYEPILYSQYALFLAECSSLNTQTYAKIKKYLDIILNDFEIQRTKKNGVPLASYVELISLLSLFTKSEPVKYDAKFDEILNWYLKQQFENGAFPSCSGSRLCFTRGTGKIFEVLVPHVEYSEKGRAKTISWLSSMQYNEENMFFVEPHLRSKLSGGFRHDYFDPSAWIDANAHLLLGIARMM